MGKQKLSKKQKQIAAAKTDEDIWILGWMFAFTILLVILLVVALISIKL